MKRKKKRWIFRKVLNHKCHINIELWFTKKVYDSWPPPTHSLGLLYEGFPKLKVVRPLNIPNVHFNSFDWLKPYSTCLTDVVWTSNLKSWKHLQVEERSPLNLSQWSTLTHRRTCNLSSLMPNWISLVCLNYAQTKQVYVALKCNFCIVQIFEFMNEQGGQY